MSILLLSCLPALSISAICVVVAGICTDQQERKATVRKVKKYRRETNMRRIQGLNTDGDYTYYLTQTTIWRHKFKKVVIPEPEHMKLAREAENAALEFDLPNPTIEKFEKMVQEALDEQEAEQKSANEELHDILIMIEREIEAEKAEPIKIKPTPKSVI